MKTNKTMVNAVDNAVFWTVDAAVDRAVEWPVGVAVFWAVYATVYETVYATVYDVGDGAVLNDPPHPSLDDFLIEVKRGRVRRYV